MTFVIAYLRDFTLTYQYIGESIETSCPWNKIGDMMKNVKKRMYEIAREIGITEKYLLAGFRVT